MIFDLRPTKGLANHKKSLKEALFSLFLVGMTGLEPAKNGYPGITLGSASKFGEDASAAPVPMSTDLYP